MTGPQRPASFTSERERIQQPAEDDRRADESAEQLGAERQLLARLVAHQYGERDRHEGREGGEQSEMAGGVHRVCLYFRPSAMSKASSTASMFSKPATMT